MCIILERGMFLILNQVFSFPFEEGLTLPKVIETDFSGMVSGTPVMPSREQNHTT